MPSCWKVQCPVASALLQVRGPRVCAVTWPATAHGSGTRPLRGLRTLISEVNSPRRAGLRVQDVSSQPQWLWLSLPLRFVPPSFLFPPGIPLSWSQGTGWRPSRTLG